MPEGDTIHRTARALEAALVGRTLTGFASSLAALEAAARRLGLVGRGVRSVSARGKHLLLELDGGVVLHTHLGMHGRWRLQPAGGPRPAGARAVVDTASVTALCLGAPTVELLASRQLHRHPRLSRLGPDLLAASFDAGTATARLRADGDREIGVALLDQRALAGIGNIYKSEALFASRLHPRRRVATLDDDALLALLATARRLMGRNLGPGPRRTTSGLTAERYFVYRRRGQPCRRCGTAVERLVQGDPPRSTYFCPRCQPPR